MNKYKLKFYNNAYDLDEIHNHLGAYFTVNENAFTSFIKKNNKV